LKGIQKEHFNLYKTQCVDLLNHSIHATEEFAFMRASDDVFLRPSRNSCFCGLYTVLYLNILILYCNLFAVVISPRLFVRSVGYVLYLWGIVDFHFVGYLKSESFPNVDFLFIIQKIACELSKKIFNSHSSASNQILYPGDLSYFFLLLYCFVSGTSCPVLSVFACQLYKLGHRLDCVNSLFCAGGTDKILFAPDMSFSNAALDSEQSSLRSSFYCFPFLCSGQQLSKLNLKCSFYWHLFDAEGNFIPTEYRYIFTLSCFFLCLNTVDTEG
ncbi:hypothetical protein T4B_2742, partial [Trichinella pseudospiralis]